MCEVLHTDPETAEWTREKGEANGQRELRRIWEKAGETAWIDPNEDSVARAFAGTSAGRFAFDHTAGCWRVWQDGRWARDTRNLVFDAARDFVRAARERLTDPPAAMARIAFSAAVERASRADPRVAVSQEVWDRDPRLLGVPGGVVDLRTGQLNPSRPEQFISRQTSVAPAPAGTPAPLWSAFLDDATRKDVELKAFLQRLTGYLLTGIVTEEVLTFLYGCGGNGKGVLLGAVTAILAEYAVAVPIEVFTAGARISVEYYRAQMAGTRLVTASETEVQTTWPELQIKEMTGNDSPLSGRHHYGQPFTFWPQFKIVLVGNYAPRLKGCSPAMERRLRVVPFNRIPAARDPDLKERLRAEYPAILRWMIDGCLQWQQKRLGTAAVITRATNAYFEQQDAFRHWIEECAVLDPTLSVEPGILLSNYNSWAKTNGEEVATSNAFAEMIDRIPSLRRVKSDGRRLVKGIGLKAPRYTNRDDP